MAVGMETIKSEFGVLRANPSNPRTITQGALDKLMESIRRDPQFMLLRPVVIGADGEVLGGNQRLKACIALGMEEMPNGWVVKADDLTPEQARRFVLVDNAPDGMAGEWDFGKLAEGYSFDELSGLGFDEGDLRAFDDVGDIGQDEVPDICHGVPFSQHGCVYRLGDHVLVCGDATKSEDVAVLMGGAKADW